MDEESTFWLDKGFIFTPRKILRSLCPTPLGVILEQSALHEAKNLGHNSLEDDKRGFDIFRNFVGAHRVRPLFIEFIGRQDASPTEFDVDSCRGGVAPPESSNFDL